MTTDERTTGKVVRMALCARTLHRLLISATVLATVSLLAMACGSDEGAPSGDVSTAGTPEGESAITLEVTLLDSYFQPNQFRVKTGQTVTFVITNQGKLTHNMRIAGPDGRGMTADDAVSEPELINGGESGVLIWIAPQPGTYAFRCDVHPDSQGTIIVEQGERLS